MGQQFDVVIVGGAITGSVLALALSDFSAHKMRIAIVEKAVPNYAEQGGFDARSIALAQGSLQKMSKIHPLAGGNLDEFLAKIATPIRQIHVSDQGHFGKTRLLASELGLNQFGAVVELAEFGQYLAQCLAAQPNITLFCPNQVREIHRTALECQLILENGEQLQTALIVAADGIQSQVAKMCGVETVLLKDYQQSAIIANVETDVPHQNQAFERFTTQGPLALLPLSGNRLSLVWCVKQSDSLCALSDEAFLAELQNQFGWKLGKLRRISARFVYSLTSQQAESHIHHRLAVVGNAAQLLHPVAGQGFNLGLRDLFELATRLGNAFQAGQDLGDYALLSAFELARTADQARIIRATSGLISLFSCEFLPAQVIRNAGLALLAHSQTGRGWVAGNALRITMNSNRSF